MPSSNASPHRAILSPRLASQRLAPHSLREPAELVAWMGAVQAQDLGAARWAIGVRLPEVVEGDVERAIAAGEILRTHVFRGTWQLVTPDDVRWMLELVAPRVLAARAGRERELGIDAALARRSGKILARVMGGGRHRTREELGAALAAEGIEASGPRLAHLLQRAEYTGLICSGAPRGRRSTFALLEERAPRTRALPRDEALRALALRYVRGRGPVTISDFTWWAGITAADARAGLEEARPALAPEPVGGGVQWSCVDGPAGRGGPAAHLLPAFDEWLIGYRDRGATLDPGDVGRVNAGGGLLAPCVVEKGRVTGIWRRTASRREVTVDVQPFGVARGRLSPALADAAARYGRFVGLPVAAVRAA